MSAASRGTYICGVDRRGWRRLACAAQPGAPVVAVILPFFTRWYFSTATAAALDHLRANGYDVLLYHLGTAEVRDQF